MGEWTVVTTLIALIGLFVSVGVPILNNTKKMTELICSIDTLSKDIQDHSIKIQEHGEKIHAQEMELAVLKEKIV